MSIIAARTNLIMVKENALAVDCISCGTPSACAENCGCTRDDLCDDCDELLCSNYVVTISGFPSICSVNTFNGSWTVVWSSNCFWYCDITPYHRVSLRNTGGLWEVYWAVTSGAYGDFNGSGTPACCPVDYTWVYSNCYAPWGCWNLCSNILANGAVSVGCV